MLGEKVDTTTKYITKFYPVTLYLSGRVNFSDYIALEFRPGVFFGLYEYFGGELGLFLRYKFWPDKMFLVAGINWHSNMGADGNSLSSSDDNFTFYGLNCGINLSKKLAFIASYYYQPERKYLFTERLSYYSDYNFKDIIKFGFDLTF